MISVLVLTKNEEGNISKCLSTLEWCDDIVVLDSYSTDSTVELATRLGARVLQRKFDDWSTHQNWAMRNIKFKNQWVFHIDADECCDDNLTQELLSFTESSHAAFRVRRKDYFLGRWLKRSQFYPTWITRFIRPDKVSYERLVNPVCVVDGTIGDLEGHLIHQPFSHGVSHWFERHNRYSDFEADEAFQTLAARLSFSELLSRHSRRIALKKLAYRIPGRPFLTLFYLLVLRMGVLDGWAGIQYASMRMSYEVMIDAKIRERKYHMKQISHKTDNCHSPVDGLAQNEQNVI